MKIGRQSIAAVAAGLLALGALACHSTPPPRHGIPMLEDAIVIDAEPVIGQPLAVNVGPQFELTLSSSEKRPAYIVWVGEIFFDIAVDENGRVVYLSTSHYTFKTPEGLHVGSTAEEARAAGAGELTPDGWACYAELPSGWRAGSFTGEPPLACEPKLSWFFKTPRSATGKLSPPPSSDGAITLAALPVIGEPFQPDRPAPFMTVVSSSNMDEAWSIQVEGVVYTVAVDPEGRVSYIGTSDPSFRTAEGLHVGMTADDLRAAGGTDFRHEHMAGCSAALPSGWRGGSEFVGQPLICKAEIVFFFKQRE